MARRNLLSDLYLFVSHWARRFTDAERRGFVCNESLRAEQSNLTRRVMARRSRGHL
jgi:hypothetical protein